MSSLDSAGFLLRRATMDDAEVLLSWRNDPETVAGSRDQRIVPLADHLRWLSDLLATPSRNLYIAEKNGIPVGTVRVDSNNNEAELSWTVAPDYRGRGYGKQMVQAIVKTGGFQYWAETRLDNIASVRLVQSLGFRQGATHAGIVRWHLDKR